MLTAIVIMNCVCMEALPLILDQFFTPWLTMTLSTTLVLIVAEILPQTCCLSRPVECGARFAWLAVLVKYTWLIIAKPMAWLLKSLTGEANHRVLFTAGELGVMMDLYAEREPTLRDRILSAGSDVDMNTPLLKADSDHSVPQNDMLASANLHMDTVTIMKGALTA